MEKKLRLKSPYYPPEKNKSFRRHITSQTVLRQKSTVKDLKEF